MRNESRSTRRQFIRTSLASTTAISLPWIIPSHALGKEGATAPSERVTLGVIGIGPRATYVLRGMLGHPDLHSARHPLLSATGARRPRLLDRRHHEPHGVVRPYPRRGPRPRTLARRSPRRRALPLVVRVGCHRR